MRIHPLYCFIIAATLAAFSLGFPHASHAQTDLFEEAGAQPLSPEQSSQLSSLQHRPTTAELRTVRFASLTPLSQGRAVTLNVFPGTRFTAENTKVKRVSDSTFTWIGEPSRAPGMIVLTVRRGQVTGTIRSKGQLFKVQSLGGGLHAVVRVDESKFPPEHPPDFDGGSYNNDGERPRTGTSDAQDSHLLTSSSNSSGGDGNIRVLVVYTDDAEAAAGDIDGLVQTAIAETNQSYENSNISASDASVTLAAARNVGYQEDGRSYSEHLGFLQNPDDGEMDIVHTWRDGYYADVVVLLVDDQGACGLAFSVYAENASEAFAVVNQDCATGNYSFGHEIGHLQGADHDERREVNEYREYGHGYIEPDSRDWRTIMALGASCGACTRLQYWSNPNVSYEGDPMGTAAEEDNARVLCETSDEIAAFRRGPLNVSLSGPSSLNSGEQGTWTADTSGSAGSISYSWAYQPACSDSRKTFTISPNRFCGWSPLSCSGPSCSHTFFNTTGETLDGGIRVTVTGAIQSETASQTVTVSSGGSYSKAGSRASGHRSGLAARSASNEAVALTWRAEGSRLPARFVVQHRADTTGTWSRIGTVAAGDSAGVDAAGVVTYRFRARDLRVGTHQFRLAYERAGQSKSARPTSAPVTARVKMEENYHLQSYPNPVRKRATLELAVKEAQDVTVAVYDLLGRRVTTLHDGRLPGQETRQLSLDASRVGLSSGTYFVRVQGEGFAATERLTVVQ